MFVAFIMVWACTPSSLRRDNRKEVSKAVNVLPVIDKAPLDTLVQKVPEVVAQVLDSLAVDSLAVDTLAKMEKKDEVAEKVEEKVEEALAEAPIAEAAAKMKRDTTTMDSLELAIYKYNKVIDDSLRLDSLNRMKKNGIDAPVKYTANDSLTYEAATGRAHLYGDSHVEYQTMDLKSEKIYMVLDSSLVHATGIRDSASGGLKGTPVFKMGSDTYENDTMAFNFKTKKGLITQVYTQQEDGFLTSEIAKRGANGELFLQHGRYTTCDEPHPDFYLALSRAKVRPG